MQHANSPHLNLGAEVSGATPGASAVAPSAAAAKPAEGAGPLVLVVDDDPEVCAYLRMCLKPVTRHVLEAGDDREALDLILQTPGLHLVITDIVMPCMDGITLRTTIKADPMLCSIPVLLITGDALDLREGPLLRKPFNARMLRTAVRALLSE